MKVTTKGQVTIPQEFREELGIYPGSEVEFVLQNRELKIVPIGKPENSAKRIIENMRGRGTIRMSTDEILALTRGEV